MNISSPDLYNSKCNARDFVDIDLIEDANCGCTGEYAHSIFTYLRDAEVSLKHFKMNCFLLSFSFLISLTPSVFRSVYNNGCVI